MKQYHKLYYWDKELIGEYIWAFDKMDGQNLRFEGNLKRGFYKFGSKTQMVSPNDENFGEGVNIFMEKYSESILSILSKKLKDKNLKFTVFGEYVGENSFAGKHLPGDKMDVVMFDIWIYKKGWISPQIIIDDFGQLGIPKLIYEGELTTELISDIQKNRFNLKEGVIAKGHKRNDIFMAKIKTNDWLIKVKNNLGIKSLYEDMDYNKKIIEHYNV